MEHYLFLTLLIVLRRINKPMAERKAYRLSGGLFDREDGTSEVKRLFFLSVEGERTEPSYFENLNRTLREFDIGDVIIHVLRHPRDGLVSPDDVYALLEECINLREKGELLPVPVITQLRQEFSDAEITAFLNDDYALPMEKKQRFNEVLLSLGINTDYRKFLATRPSSSDRFVVVVDRDCHSHSRECLERVTSQCADKGFIFCLSNPCFEFWLLLHLVSADSLSRPEELTKIQANGHISKRHTYVSGRVSTMAKHAKCISEQSFNRYYKPNIAQAMSAATQFATTPNAILDNVGTTVPLMIYDIFAGKPIHLVTA